MILTILLLINYGTAKNLLLFLLDAILEHVDKELAAVHIGRLL